MKNVAIVLLLLSVSCPLSAMDEGKERISTISAVKEESPIIYFPHSFVVYIGNCKDREDIEKIYGEKFPLNTPFFEISFRNVQKDIRPFPMYIAYKFIKNKKEGDSLSLTLNKKACIFLCTQEQEDDIRRHNNKFQDFVRVGYERFLKSANCLVDGEESLFEAGIIKRKGSYIRHGENGTKESLPE